MKDKNAKTRKEKYDKLGSVPRLWQQKEITPMSAYEGTFFRPTGTTRLGGLIGSPVSHSLSPMMHNDSFYHLGIDYIYLCFDAGPDKLPEVVKGLRYMNTYGFNLTMPDKAAVIPCLDEITKEASLCGAVNTVVNREGRLIGYNTDGTGFMRALKKKGFDAAGKEITLIGAGGAGSAIASAAVLGGFEKLHLACRRSRSWEKAVDLADRLSRVSGKDVDLIDLADAGTFDSAVSRSALLVNATNVGMEPNPQAHPLPLLDVLKPGLWVADAIYHPRQTLLIKQAQARGLDTIEGLDMLLGQGEEAFKLWTGQDMPVDLICKRYFGG